MAGAGYKLFNTGDVLTAAQVNTYLMEQTVMVFANAAARTTALSGVVSEGMISYLKDTNAVEVYDGSNWVSSDDPNAIQNTIVDAKGDLITATAADTPSRIAVGNNGETLVADSSATTGLRWQGAQAAGKNAIINGGMDIWQRGTSIAMTAGELFTADRWFVYRGGFVTGGTVSRQNSGVNFTRYGLRLQRDSGNTSTQPLYLNTTLETQDSIGYAGQTITFSFYAKAGANYSGGALTGRVLYGTGTDQRVTSFTGIGVTLSVSATLTTSYQRFQGTATVNASATEIGFDFGYTPTGTASTNDWVEITGVQFELGSIATTFQRAGGTLAGELAACQRYYWRQNSTSDPYTQFGYGASASTTLALIPFYFPVTMRAVPTVLDYSTLAIQEDFLGGVIAVTSATLSASTQSLGLFQATVASGLTKFRPERMFGNNSTSAYVGFSAEL